LIKKCFPIGIIFLLLTMSFTSNFYILKSKGFTVDSDDIKPIGQIWYVGGTGQNNFTRIQDAIDNASDGDTVFVFSGVYSDFFPNGQWGYSILINKEITLIGENKYNTIINGNGQRDVVRITSHRVNIKGFTIQNSGGVLYGGIKVVDYYGMITIQDNIIKNNSNGIYLFLNAEIIIKNNIIEKNTNGVYIFDVRWCTVINNIISNNTNGIYHIYGSTDGIEPENEIFENIIRDNVIGLKCDNSRNFVRFNNFINNDHHYELRKGVYVSGLHLLLKMRNKWYKNYYDDWDIVLPKPIMGWGVVAIDLIRIQIPIFIYPYFQIDRYPAQEPYDIEV